MEENRTHMFSFDVFDTLITRKTATPDGIFAVMQHKLCADNQYANIATGVKESFYVLRKNAEALARESICRYGIEDITLEEIYSAMSGIGELSDNDIYQLIDLEKETELECSVPIRVNINRVKELCDKGKKVILISDMYHSSEFIRTLLLLHDDCFGNVDIYVSSEYRKTKSAGNLYYLIAREQNLNADEWVHVGDNSQADVSVPERMGIRCEPYGYESLKEYEKALIKNKESEWKYQLCIGDARNIRIKNMCNDKGAIGESVAGPIFTSYVSWILEMCTNKGIKQLYFIARDGYILKIIADILIERKQYDIKTSYIYGSRRAWRMAAFVDRNFDIEKLLELSHRANINSLDKVAGVFGLSVDEIEKYIPTEYRRKEQYSFAETGYVFNCLKQDDNFLNYIIGKNIEKRQKVVGYLKQEIKINEGDFAFVELSGSGYTQLCLGNIMQDLSSKPIKTFYFQMDKTHRKEEGCIFYDYSLMHLKYNAVIEALARAPHGQTVAYKNIDGNWLPVFDESSMVESKALLEYGFDDFAKGVEGYAKSCDLDNLFSLSMVYSYMCYITQTPSAEVLDYIGDMPFECTGRKSEQATFAPKLSDGDIRKIFLMHPQDPVEYYYKGTYIGYSCMRCTDKQRKKIDFYKKHRYDVFYKLVRFIFTGKMAAYTDIDFPYKDLKGRIIVYAAGKVGADYIKKFKKMRKVTVVLWADRNYQFLVHEKYKVSSPSEILKTNYDYLVVAVEKESLAKSIEKDLIAMGVEQGKILWRSSK